VRGGEIMSTNKRTAAIGVSMFGCFVVILVMMFMPLFGGKNTLEYLDDLYNSISKGSAYYIPAMREEIDAVADSIINVTLEMKSEEQAEQTALLYRESGTESAASGTAVTISGNLGKMLENCLNDADIMYNNNGDEIEEKYGYNGRHVLFNWWQSLQAMDKELSKQKRFKEAKIVALIEKKAVEASYNYYGVDPQKITDRLGVVVFSLIFYVIYTLWYGFAIMYMFEGWGLRLGH